VDPVNRSQCQSRPQARTLSTSTRHADSPSDSRRCELGLPRVNGDYSRMFNRKVAMSIVKDGKLTPMENGKFVDMTNALEGTRGGV
jgi:hypothetical protein